MQHRYRMKLKEIQHRLVYKQSLRINSALSWTFLVFRNSNAETKSGLGIHNEILSVMSHEFIKPQTIQNMASNTVWNQTEWQECKKNKAIIILTCFASVEVKSDKLDSPQVN